MPHEDLDLDLGGAGTYVPRPGRKALDLQPEVLRALTPEDIELLRAPSDTQAEPIKRLSERHHSLARMIAAGMKPGDAAMATSYGASRVSILLGDPTFVELVEFYREGVEKEFLTTMQHVSGLAQDTVTELRYRLEDTPETFGNRELRELAAMALDRAGFGPGVPSSVAPRAPQQITPETSHREAADIYAELISKS